MFTEALGLRVLPFLRVGAAAAVAEDGDWPGRGGHAAGVPGHDVPSADGRAVLSRRRRCRETAGPGLGWAGLAREETVTLPNVRAVTNRHSGAACRRIIRAMHDRQQNAEYEIDPCRTRLLTSRAGMVLRHFVS